LYNVIVLDQPVKSGLRAVYITSTSVAVITVDSHAACHANGLPNYRRPPQTTTDYRANWNQFK